MCTLPCLPAVPPVLSAVALSLSALSSLPGSLQEEPSPGIGQDSTPKVLPQEGVALELELEALDGSRRRIQPGHPVLEDLREEEAWIVRVLGGKALEGDGAASIADSSSDPGDGPGVVDRAEISLVGGDQLRGRILRGAGDQLEIEIAGSAELPLAIDVIAHIVIPANLPGRLAVPLEAPAEGDRIYRRTGSSLDRDDGAVLGFNAEGVQFESLILGERLIAWEELAALFVETLVEPEAGQGDEGLRVVVDLVDGSRLRGLFGRLDAASLEMTVGNAIPLALPLARVELLVVDDGRLAFLSDLTPREEIGRGSPFGDEIGLVFDHVMDRAVTGGGLRVAGRHYARGIGTHAPTRLLFEIPEGWLQLRGKVGVDDSSARLSREARGSVHFSIKWNGETLWESPLVRGGAAAMTIPTLNLPAVGERLLELEVDPGEDFRGDRANWLELLLVRG